MASRNRARSFGGGGGGIDLGALLLAAFGGLEANPDFAQQGPTTSGTPLGGVNPYRAKTIFDRADASNANADYNAQILAAEADSARRVNEFAQLLPFQKQDYQNQADVNTAAELQRGKNKVQLELENRPKFDEMDVQKYMRQAQVDVLKNKDIVPNTFDIQRVIREVNPETIAAAISSLKTKMAGDKATMADIERDQVTKGATFPANLETAQIQATGNRDLAKGEASQLDDLLQFKKLSREQSLIDQQADRVRQRYMPVGNGTVLDLFTPGKPTSVYQAPTGLEQAGSILGNVPTQLPAPQSLGTNTSPAQATGETTEITIDGVKVRVPTAALQNLQAR
jgi:hypothetical protein